jgi:hypothetical protein
MHRRTLVCVIAYARVGGQLHITFFSCFGFSRQWKKIVAQAPLVGANLLCFHVQVNPGRVSSALATLGSDVAISSGPRCGRHMAWSLIAQSPAGPSDTGTNFTSVSSRSTLRKNVVSPMRFTAMRGKIYASVAEARGREETSGARNFWALTCGIAQPASPRGC